MADCTCDCVSGTCALAEEPIYVGQEFTPTGACHVYRLDFESSGDINLGLTPEGYLTGDIVISPDENNILSAESDGILSLNHVLGNESGSTGASWTQSSVAFQSQQTTTLVLPDGKWFVEMYWRAQARKNTSVISDAGAKFIYRAFISHRFGGQRVHRWNDTEGVLLQAGTAVTISDVFSTVIRGDQTVTVGIETAIDPAGADNDIDFSQSRISAMAVRDSDE